MTIERVALADVDELIATGALVDAKIDHRAAARAPVPRGESTIRG